MSAIEAVKALADTVLKGDKKIISIEEIDYLLAKAQTQEERELYLLIYNYLLQQRQKEVIANESY